MTLAPELTRRANNKSRILAALEDGPKTNVQLAAIGGLRFGGRLHELREEYEIRTEPLDGGLVRYVLVGPHHSPRAPHHSPVQSEPAISLGKEGDAERAADPQPLSFAWDVI